MEIRYRVSDYFSVPCGQGFVSLSSSDSRTQKRYPALVANFLSRCKQFKSISEHAGDCIQGLSATQKLAAIKVLIEFIIETNGTVQFGYRMLHKMLGDIFSQLAEEGIFIADKTLIEWGRTERDSSPAKAEQISSVGIITCNRVENLKRALSSYMGNLTKYNRKARIVVFDDSKDPAIQEANQQVIRDCIRQYSVPVWYAGLPEKKAFAKILGEQGIPPEILEFALFDRDSTNYSYGANCNSFFLETVGELVFVTDDDTVCRLSRAQDSEDGIQFGTDNNPYSVWFFPERAQALSDFPELEYDFLALHERYLGLSLRNCLPIETLSRNGNSPLQHLSTKTINEMRRQKGKVFLTHSGLLGDSGSNSPVPNLFSTGSQFERMVRTEGAYRSALRSREVAKSPLRDTLVASDSCMSTFYGADNRSIVPPFFPVYRNCDALFGETYRHCSEGSYFAYLRHQLYHQPPEARQYTKEDLSLLSSQLWPEEAIRMGLNSHLLNSLLGPLESGLFRAGNILIEIGNMPFTEYRRRFVELRKMDRCQELINYETLLEKSKNAPAFWRQDVGNMIERLKSEMSKPVRLTADGFSHLVGEEFGEKIVHRYIREFGQLCKWWPEIVRNTKQLKDNGRFLARQIEK